MSGHAVPPKGPQVNIMPGRPKPVNHDQAPSVITDHKYAPMDEWYSRCRYCRLAEAAHAQSEIQYYGDGDGDN